MAITTAELVRKYLKLTREKAEKEGAFNDAKADLAAIEATLLERFQNSKTKSQRVDGYTVFVRRELFAKPSGLRLATLRALKDAGYADMVEENFNTNRLSALVREFAEEEETRRRNEGQPDLALEPEEIRELLPEPLKPTVKVSEKFSIRARKG